MKPAALISPPFKIYIYTFLFSFRNEEAFGRPGGVGESNQTNLATEVKYNHYS